MRTLDQDGKEVVPDLELGHTVPDKILVAHHEAKPDVEEVWHWKEVQTFPNGGKIVDRMVEQEYQPAEDSWDEYEDILRYIPYTDAELAEIAAEKAAQEQARKEAEDRADQIAKEQAEREEFLTSAPERLGGVENTQLDADEAVCTLYEQIAQMQVDTDEAIVSLYELMI